MICKLKGQISITEKLVERIVIRFNTKVKKEGLELAKMKLGLEIFFINIGKFAIVFLIASYFNLLKESLFMSLVFGSIRSTAFGLHAKNSLVCSLITNMMFVAGPYVSYHIKLDNYTVLAAFIIMIFCFYKYAPADTENHPVLGEKLRLKLRKKTVVKSLFFMAITLIVKIQIIKAMIILTLGFNVISILPITYKILNRRYNNYERYERTNY
ncbi:accessory gene regulator B family protein [Clostridium sp.]|uniref:accessory gene regulator B family protein n=1 Tax=Clostridium sp. TaxID=1506 RepID=UPI002609E010|nr:accessory gene regulator B family protein [Clostridium sp.]